jgi:hypothetical protein
MNWLKNCFAEAYAEADRREKFVNKIVLNLIKLEEDIEIMEKAIRNPPREASEQEMDNVNLRLKSSYQTRRRAIAKVEEMGFNVDKKRESLKEKSKKID